MPSVLDEKMMRRCLELANRGARVVFPNPMVGCVLAVDGEIIAEGWHQKYGAAHAECLALLGAEKELLSRSTLYVNLEPCAHSGRTPPCAEQIIRAGITRVKIGAADPFPLVNGKGISRLRQAGIEVQSGILEAECRNLNRRFYTLYEKQRPYVILKWAQTKDGYLAKKDGSSRWISSEESRKLAHQWRAEEAAVLVGTETALKDNPELTVRHVPGMHPLRVVLDRKLRLPKNLNLFNGAAPACVLNEGRETVEGGTRYLKADFSSLSAVMRRLAGAGVCSVLVEGGAALLNSFIREDLWDEIRYFESAANFGSGIKAPELPDADFEKIPGGDALYRALRREISGVPRATNS